jgi:hypothetical protein
MIVPQEHFAGTWDTAIHESAKAAKEVGKASKSYFSAVASSGIGKVCDMHEIQNTTHVHILTWW